VYLKPCALYKCSIFNFLDRYDSKLQPNQVFVTTNVVLLAHYRSGNPCSHTFPVRKGKGKAVPLQARVCPENSRKLSFPDFVTTA